MNWEDLDEDDKQHLAEQEITTLEHFTEVAASQAEIRAEYRNIATFPGISDISGGMSALLTLEPCHHCKSIAKKLGLPI